MIEPKVNDTKGVICPCRLCYTHVFNKYTPDGDASTGKYMTNVLIPKSEKATVNAIKQAIEAAKKQATVSKWGGKEPKKLDLPLRDGDTDKEDDNVTQTATLSTLRVIRVRVYVTSTRTLLPTRTRFIAAFGPTYR